MKISIILMLLTMALSPSLKGDETSDAHIDHILEVANTSFDDAIKLVEADGVSLYDFGMSIYMKYPDKALYWFSVLSDRYPDKLDYHFGVGWVYWIKDDLLAAQKQAVYILSLDSTDELFKARTHYLLGITYMQTGSLDHAKKELDISSSMFEKLKLNGGMLNCGLAHVDLLYINGQLDQAEEMLKKCEAINVRRKDPPSGIPAINYRKGSISFRKGNISQAIEEFKLSEKADMATDPSCSISSKTNLAICLSFQGDAKGAAAYAQEVDKILQSTEEQGFQYYYNCIAWKFIFKCQGDDSNHLDSKILGWANSTSNNALLLNMFELINASECGNSSKLKEPPNRTPPLALTVCAVLVLAGLAGIFFRNKQKPV